MGILKYYICPWNRKLYDKMFPRRVKEGEIGCRSDAKKERPDINASPPLSTESILRRGAK